MEAGGGQESVQGEQVWRETQQPTKSDGCGHEQCFASSETLNPELEEEEPEPETLYERLGVDINAPATSIKASYRRLARMWHPDRHPQGGGGEGEENHAKTRFQQVQQAYEVLSNEYLRAHYDLRLLERFAIEDYLHRYQGFTLTASGLGLASRSSSCTASFDGSTENSLLLTH